MGKLNNQTSRKPGPNSPITGPAAWQRHDRLLPASLDRDPVLHLLLHGGHQGSVSGRQGAQEAELEVPHEVHDVVPEARGTQDHQ